MWTTAVTANPNANPSVQKTEATERTRATYFK